MNLYLNFIFVFYIFIINAYILFVGTNEGATLQNIDNYVERLESLLNGNVEQSLRNAVRNAVSRLELIG